MEVKQISKETPILEIPLLSEELEKLLTRTSNDFMSLLVNLDGNLTDILDGTLIKIPMDAGYVKLYKTANKCSLSLWLSNELLELSPKSTPNNS